jgi:hypothetical protein
MISKKSTQKMILYYYERFTEEFKSNIINKGPLELLHVTGADVAAT